MNRKDGNGNVVVRIFVVHRGKTKNKYSNIQKARIKTMKFSPMTVLRNHKLIKIIIIIFIEDTHITNVFFSGVHHIQSNVILHEQKLYVILFVVMCYVSIYA
jgi:outer membrane protein assembly factor BamA